MPRWPGAEISRPTKLLGAFITTRCHRSYPAQQVLVATATSCSRVRLTYHISTNDQQLQQQHLYPSSRRKFFRDLSHLVCRQLRFRPIIFHFTSADQWRSAVKLTKFIHTIMHFQGFLMSKMQPNPLSPQVQFLAMQAYATDQSLLSTTSCSSLSSSIHTQSAPKTRSNREIYKVQIRV